MDRCSCRAATLRASIPSRSLELAGVLVDLEHRDTVVAAVGVVEETAVGWMRISAVVLGPVKRGGSVGIVCSQMRAPRAGS